MRRLMVLVTAALLMTAMSAVSISPALGAPTLSVGGGGGVAVDPAACEWAAGTGGLEWRAGGVCWLELPGWNAF